MSLSLSARGILICRPFPSFSPFVYFSFLVLGWFAVGESKYGASLGMYKDTWFV